MTSGIRFTQIALPALLLGAMLMFAHQPVTAEPAYRSVPKASCGAEDRSESGLQGQTTFAERFNAGPARAYHCNLELVGHFQDEGNAGFLQVMDECVYSATWENARMQHPGVTVLDVSDPGAPRESAYLTSPAMLNPNQSLRVDPVRRLLFANRFNTSRYDIYDLSGGCGQPVLKKTVTVPGTTAHFLQLSGDGRTLYGSSCCAGMPQYPYDAGIPPAAIFALDASDPLNLRRVATWIAPEKWSTHGVSLNADASRAYATIGRTSNDQVESGVLVLDLGEIERREPKARIRPVGSLFWDDTSGGELPVPIRVRGQPYLVFTDLLGTVVTARRRSRAQACISGKPSYGFARLIDIGDEKAPRLVSRLMLEVHHPRHCKDVQHDPAVSFGYGSMFCAADNPDDAKMLACGYFEAGLRVFDIRDPENPTEIAYYKPPAPRLESRPGSVVRNLHPEPRDHTADQVWYPIFRKGGQEIWFASSGGGFYVVRFSEAFKAAHKVLF